MATVGKIQAHKPLVRPHDGLVHLQIGRATAQALDIDTPLLRIQTKGVESALLAKQFDLVNMLVTAIVPGARVSLRVLVRHGRAERIEDSAGSDILRGDKENGLALTLDFFLLNIDVSIVPIQGFGIERTIIFATSGSVSTKDFSMSCDE